MDLTVNYKNVADESLVQQDGTVKKFKRYDFFIGKFGPFVERFELESFNEGQVAARVSELKRHLGNLPS